MKKILTPIIIILAILTTAISTQARTIQPPKQTDTLLVFRVRYKGQEILPQNWPAKEIYKSADSFRFGNSESVIKRLKGAKYNQRSANYGNFDMYMYNLDGSRTMLIMEIKPGSKIYPMTGISIDGYDILAVNKNSVSQVNTTVKTILASL